MAGDENKRRSDSTMEVLLDELEDAKPAAKPAPTSVPLKIGKPPTGGTPSAPIKRDQSLDSLLAELDREVPGTPRRDPTAPPPPPAVRRPSVPPMPVPSAARKPASMAPPPLGGTGTQIATHPTASGTPSPAARPVPRAAPPRREPPRAPPPAGLEQPVSSVEVWERELQGITDPARKGRLHFEIGRIHEVRGRDFRKAAQHYQEALSRMPEHVPSIQGARRALLAQKAYREALPLFDSEARVTSDAKKRAALHLAKGRVFEDLLGSKPEARAQYTIALDLDKSDPTILKALEQADAESGSHAELARTYERAANAVTNDPRHRAALVVLRARTLELRLKDTDGAISLYETALRLDPEAAFALEALERLYQAQKRHRDLAAVLERKVTRATDANVRAMTLHRVASLQERLGSRDEAISALERALAVAPEEPLVLEDLARLYDAAGRPADLVAILERLAQLQSATRFDRAMLKHRIGTLREEKLDDEDGAIVSYESVLAIDPLHLATLQALTKIHQRRKDHGSLLRILIAEADASIEPRRRAATHARIGEIYELEEKNPELAIEHHARALAIVAGHPASFKALTRLYAEAQRWRELVTLYARAIEEAGAGEPSITFLMKTGAIYEDALGEPAQAVLAYKRVLTMEPKNLGAIQALQRAAERAGSAAVLVEALELEAALVALNKDKGPKATLGILHRAGEVLDDLLGDRDGAIARLRKVLAIDPTYAPALSSLGKLLHRAGRWEDLLDLYDRELKLASGPDAVVALRLKMGEICEARTGRDDEALKHYRAAVSADARNGRALDALARKLKERGAHEELAQVLELSLASLEPPKGKTDAGTSDPKARARAAHRIAEVREDRLNDPSKALGLYELARDLDPTYRPAVDAIARLRAADNAHRKLLDELEREARAATNEQIAIATWLRAGEVAGEHLAEPKRAIACFEAVLEREPGHLAALLAMEQLTRRAGALEPLARVLASLSRALTEPAARVSSLRELARLQETRLPTKPADLRVTYEAILALAPDDAAALASLERIAIETSDRALLASIDERIADESKDPSIVAAHRGRLAENLLDTGDPRATSAFLAAVEADPESLAAVRGLRRAAEIADQPKLLTDALRREARLSTDPKATAALLVRAGAIAKDVLDDPNGAYADFERALELDPDDETAAGPVLELLLLAGQAGRAVDRLGRAALAARLPDRIAALSLEVSRLQAEMMNDVAGAIATLSRALRSAPGNTAILLALGKLCARDGHWPEAADKLRAVIELTTDATILKGAHLDLAAIELERLDDLGRAANSLAAVLALEPDNTFALSLLATLERRAGRHDKAVEALKRLVAATPGRAEKAAALVEMAKLEQSRGDAGRAFDALHEAVALEGPYGPSARAFRAALTSTDQPGWSRYAQALYDHVRRAAAEGPRAGAGSGIYVSLADVLDETLGRRMDALEVLREAMRAHADDPELARRFAQQALRADRPFEGVEALRKLLEVHPAQPDLHRDLGAAISKVHPDASTIVLGPLSVLSATTPDEDQRLRARVPGLGRVHRESFGHESLALLYRIDFNSPALAMIAALPEALVRLYPPDLDGLGVGRSDRLTQRSGHPLRGLADRVGALLHAGEFELYTHHVRGRGVAVELSEPVSILVPASISELSEAGQTFLLGRVLANASLGLSMFDKLTPRELEVMLAAAARVVSPRFGAGLTSEEVLDDQCRRIQKAISRKARQVLAEVAPRYVSAGAIDLAALSRSVAHGAARAGALLSDDLRESVEALRRTERDYASADGAQLVASTPLVADLVRFWSSDVALDVRRRAGLL